MKLFPTILTCLVVILCIRLICFVLFQPALYTGQHLDFTTTILTQPTTTGSTNSLFVAVGNMWGSARVRITYPATTQLAYGQTVHISGTVKDTVTKNNSVIKTMRLPHIEIAQHSQNTILALANAIRQKTADVYASALSPTDAGLLLGIVLGMKANFSRTFTQDLQATGVLHVIAASGMNVSMVAGVLFSLAVIFFRRQIAIVLCVFGVIFYMIFSGLQASILRAGIMALFGFSAQLIGRQYSGVYGLFLAAWCMLMYQPSLISDIGFQLSLGSTLGIILIKPLFPKNIGFEDAATTLAAQLMTLPILLVNFGSYGLFSILVNFLVLWTIPPLMILGAVGGLLGFIWQSFADIFLWLCIPLLWFFEHVVTYFGSLGFTVQLQTIPVTLIIGYYLLLFSIIVSIKIK